MSLSRYQKPKININATAGYKNVKSIIGNHMLNTVCEEARCPNIYNCWERETITIMILGDICTRSCGFCSVKTGKPSSVDLTEPKRVAKAVKDMNPKHVVLTSVDRDDLKGDFGSENWAQTIYKVRGLSSNCTIEVLTPDFQANEIALQNIFYAKPDIFSHNVECVERISKQVRAQANWQRSLAVLKKAVLVGLPTKSGIMVGLGETTTEVLFTMQQIAELGVKIFTIGQYLQPTKTNLPVQKYVNKSEFKYYQEEGLKMGFDVVESGTLVRSSYNADKQARLIL